MLECVIAHPWMSLGVLLVAWLGVGAIVGPILGRFCKMGDREW